MKVPFQIIKASIYLFCFFSLSACSMLDSGSKNSGLSSMRPVVPQATSTLRTHSHRQANASSDSRWQTVQSQGVSASDTEAYITIAVQYGEVTWPRNGKHDDCSIRGRCLHNDKRTQGQVVHVDDANHQRLGSGTIRDNKFTVILPNRFIQQKGDRLRLRNIYIGGSDGLPVGYPAVGCKVGTTQDYTHACPEVQVRRKTARQMTFQ